MQSYGHKERFFKYLTGFKRDKVAIDSDKVKTESPGSFADPGQSKNVASSR